MSHGKTTGENAETRKRIDFVREAFSRGVTRETIEATCAAKWNISERQVRNYLKIVVDEWKAARPAPEEVRAQIREALWSTYRAAREGEKPQLMVAAVVLDRLAKLEGVNAPEKVEHLGTVIPFGFTSVDQARARIQELLAKQGLDGKNGKKVSK